MDSNNLYKVGEEFQVQSAVFFDPIIGLDDGGFIITWTSSVSGQADNNGFGVYGQRYDANGKEVDGKFLINQITNGNQEDSAVTYKNGKLIVSWTGIDAGLTKGIYTREFELVNKQILSEENFENGALGWSKSQTIDGGADTSTFLGRFGGSYGKEDVSKTYDFGIANAGKVVTIKFDFYEIDSWDNHALKVFANGLEVHSQNFGSDTLGYKDVNGTSVEVVGSQKDGSYANWYDDEKHVIEITAVLDENGKLKLGFGSTLDEAITNESYGIDNITISTNTIQPLGNDKLVNTVQTYAQDDSSITYLKDGSYVVSWTSCAQDGSYDGVYLQKFDANGNKVGSEQSVNTYYTFNQNDSTITGLNNGGYVIVWTSYAQDGSCDGVYMQRFDGNGQKLGAEEQVADSTYLNQNQPSVDALEEGGFVVSWTGYNKDTLTTDIYTQRYTNDGVKLGRAADFVINEDEAYTFNAKLLLKNDVDDEGDKFDIVSVQNAKDGKVELVTLANGEKEVTFIPNEGFNGKTSFTYTIQDVHGATDTAEVTVDVLSDGKYDRVYHLDQNESVDISELKLSDTLDMNNNSVNDIRVNLDDLIDRENSELIVKGELNDKVTLDNKWETSGTQKIDGSNYNVYKGTNTNIKLLIDEDVTVNM